MVLMDHGERRDLPRPVRVQLLQPARPRREQGAAPHHQHRRDERATWGWSVTTGSPQGVDLATEKEPAFKRHATEKGDFVWQMGASLAAESLATGKELLITPEHALHVLEVMQAGPRVAGHGPARRSFSRRSSGRW